jgi:hypothetical protein
MGTVQVIFEEEQPEVTEVTCPEVTRSHVTGRGYVRKCVLRMLNRKLRTICPSGAFFTGSDKVTWPEDVLPREKNTPKKYEKKYGKTIREK